MRRGFYRQIRKHYHNTEIIEENVSLSLLRPPSRTHSFLCELQVHEIVKCVLQFATGRKRVKCGATVLNLHLLIVLMTDP